MTDFPPGPSRRAFLQHASAAAMVGASLKPWGSRLWRATPEELMDPIPESLLREYAAIAMDEAKRGGASFADVRVITSRSVTLTAGAYQAGGGPVFHDAPRIDTRVTFGIRTVVNGSWGSASGYHLNRDRIVEVTRRALAGAKLNRARHRQTLDLAPAPVVADGLWATPIEKDPFAVTLAEQRDVAKEALTQLQGMQYIVSGSIGIKWRSVTVMFASTEGTRILQRLKLALPSGFVKAQVDPNDYETMADDWIQPIKQGPYGYEALGAGKLVDGVKTAAAGAIEASKKGRVSATSVEVGRYDIVFGANAVQTLLCSTLAPALSLPRALGYEANQDGTSFIAPPDDMLGNLQIASPLLTVHADRSQPGAAATVGWDEEGVAPEPYTFIREGRPVDYHADRQTVVELANWYKSRKLPMRSHGVTRRTEYDLPGIALPNLTMDPGKADVKVDDMISGIKRGFLVQSCGGSSDQQLLSGQYGASHKSVRKITNGVLGGHVSDFALQFTTVKFWKSVDAIGGPSTVNVDTPVTSYLDLYAEQFAYPYSTVKTVPMRVRDVNVLNTGRQA